MEWKISDGAVLDAFPVGGVVCDPAGCIAQVNSALLAMFGYTEGELLGQSIAMLLPECDRIGHAAHVQHFFADPAKRSMGGGRVLHGMRKDGSVFPIEIGLNPIGSGPQAVLATVLGITDRVRQEHNFRQIFEFAPVGMMMVNGEGRIHHVNESLMALFGYARHEMEGQFLEMLLPERYRKAHQGYLQGYQEQSLARPMGQGRDLTGLHKTGIEFPVEVGLNPIEISSGKYVIATVTNISERKKAELKLQQLNADLDEFTYVASHDLRSPLRGISSLVEWIEEDLEGSAPESVQNNIGRIRTRIGRMEKLVDDLLTYARSGKHSRDSSVIDINRMLLELIGFMDIPSGFSVTHECAVATMNTARTPLETVLRNLLSNALKHHDRSGGIIRVVVSEEGNYCVFDVIDDGPGIPANAHERIFKLFQTLAKKDENHSGIGLAVCKRLVEAHGGKITVHSDPEVRGARFRFWWPRFARSDINE